MLIDKTPIVWTMRRGKSAPNENSSIRSIAAQGEVSGKLHRGLPTRKPLGGMRGLLIAMTWAAAAVLAGCSAPPDEAALRDRIAGLQAAVEARDADTLLDAVDPEFGGPEGMDRDGLRRYATLMLLRQQNVGVVVGPVEVALHGDRASASFDAVVSGSNRFLPEGVEARRVETVWRRDGDEWVLVSADWSKPALGG
jgi:hypothetical protein